MLEISKVLGKLKSRMLSIDVLGCLRFAESEEASGPYRPDVNIRDLSPDRRGAAVKWDGTIIDEDAQIIDRPKLRAHVLEQTLDQSIVGG
jgi:hypothetical protein